MQRLHQIQRQLVQSVAAGDEEAEGTMKVVPSRQGHMVSGPTRTGHGSGGSAAKFMQNDAPTPSHAEKTRTLLNRVGNAVLSTTHQELDYPYGSTINIAADELGRPYTFVSTMAEHTANLLTSAKASIVVTEVQGSGDQLAQARTTLVGDMETVEKTEALKSEFLRVHESAFYVDFDDFICMRMEVKAIRYIGGFGDMSWVEPAEFNEADVDPVAADVEAVDFAVGHMNEDHAEATLMMVQQLAGLPDAVDATILAMDRYGFDVLAQVSILQP